MNSPVLLGQALAFAALLMFSVNIILTKVASARLALDSGFLVSVTVNLGFSAVLLGMQLLLRDQALRWDLAGFLLFVCAGACSTYLGRFFFFEAIGRLGPARASTFQVTSPLFAAFIAWIFLGDALGPSALFALGLTMLGLLLSAVDPRALLRGRGGRPLDPDGVPAPAVTPSLKRRLGVLVRSGFALGLGSSIAYAAGNVLRGAAIRHWNEVVLGALLGAIAALLLHLFLGAGGGSPWGRLRGADRRGLAFYAMGGVLSISAQMCVIASMRYIPVAIASLIAICTPLLVFPMSYFLLGNAEGIGARTIVGALLTLSGIVVIVLA